MSEIKSKDYLVIGNDEYDFFESIDNGKSWRLADGSNYDQSIIDPEPYPPIPEPYPPIPTPPDPSGYPGPGPIPNPNPDLYPKPDPGPIPVKEPYKEIKYPYYYGFPNGPIVNVPNKIILNEPIPEPHNYPIVVDLDPNPDPDAWPKKDIIHDVPPTFRIEVEKDKNGNIINKELIKYYDLYELIKNGFSVDDLLLYILNDIIIPYLSFKLMSTSGISDIKNNKFDLNTKFYTNSELYLTFDGLDFESDVGMQPLRKEDTKLYKEMQNYSKELSDEYIDKDTYEKYIDNMLKYNDDLKFSFSVIDAKLNIIKEELQKDEIKNIEATEESYEGLEENEKPMMKYFYSIKKGADESIMGTIINSIFTFNNSKKLALLKTSIINVAYSLKESIKYKLIKLYDIIISGDYNKEEVVNSKLFKNILNYNLIEEWNKSLTKSIIDYYTEARSNIFAITENNDKNLITAASNKYRDIREFLIDEVTRNLPSIDENSIINDKDVIELNTKTNNLLLELIDNINKIINDSDFKNKFNNLLAKFNEDEKELLNNISFINNLLYHYSGVFFEDVKELISENNQNIKSFLYFERMDYYDSLYGLSSDELSRTFKYYEDILDEFKRRCFLLYNISGESVIDNYIKKELHIYKDLKVWANNLLISSDKEKFIKDNNLNYLYDNTKNTIKDLFSLTNNEWVENRGKI